MLYQYKREPLNNEEVNKLINFCDISRGKFVTRILLDATLTLS